MKILVVHYFDDNYGDMLIGVCFRQLLKVVLRNAGIRENETEIVRMHLKSVDRELILSSDVIFFAGGGLFGQSYLGFADSFEQILDIAEEADIPVALSSMGVNNMSQTPENEGQLSHILSKKCIRYISVRENRELFESFLPEGTMEVQQVCDPVVWARHVYSIEAKRKQPDHEPVIGINVVRGGLFEDNGYEWRFRDELTFLSELTEIFRREGIRFRLYTNGSFLDNETLKQFVYENGISSDEYVLVHTSSELVNTISDFDAVVSVRMHSSIIAYSLGIPAVNLIWNDKIPLFYEYTGHPERAIALSDWKPSDVAARIMEIKEEDAAPDKEYMMSLYRYILDVSADFFNKEMPSAYSFGKIIKELSADSDSIDEDDLDRSYYILHAENRFAQLFRKNMEKVERITDLKERYNDLKQKDTEKIESLSEKVRQQKEKIARRDAKLEHRDAKIASQEEKIDRQKERITGLKEKVNNKNETITRLRKELERQRTELEWLNSRKVVKAYRKLVKSPFEEDEPAEIEIERAEEEEEDE